MPLATVASTAPSKKKAPKERPLTDREVKVAQRRNEVAALYPEASPEQLSVLSELGDTHYLAWKILAAASPNPVCRSCVNITLKDANLAGLGDNGSGPLRTMRQKGLNISHGEQRPGCPIHTARSTTWQFLADPLPSLEHTRSRAGYSAKEWAAIKTVVGSVDAFTCAGVASAEIDHRVPFSRLNGQEEKVDTTDRAAITARYMALSPSSNSIKRQKCESCILTNIRPEFQGVKYYFEGSEKYEPSVGCNGCGYAYPETWRHNVQVVLKSVQGRV